MIKKIALAASLAATASFATWDYFPVQEAGKGQAEVIASYSMQGDYSGFALGIGARYTIVQNFELGIGIPYTVFTDDGWDETDDPDGLNNIPLMLRYQFMPAMNAFLDVELPVGDEEIVGYNDGLGFYFGVQYSQKFGMVDFGSELGLGIRTEGDDEISPPFDLHIGLEGDFAINEMLTPYVGLDLNMWLGEYTHDGDELLGSDASGKLGIAPFVGLNIAINQMFYAGIQATFGIGDDYYGEDMPIALQGKFGVNF